MFVVNFTTNIGGKSMNFCAGRIDCATVEAAKPKATDLMLRRNLRNVVTASIDDDDGNQVAIANPSQLKLFKPQFEWLTIHPAKKR